MNFYNLNASLYANNTFDSRYADQFFDDIKDFLSLNSMNRTILEIGSGSGRDAMKMTQEGFSIKALDASPEMVEEAKELTGLKDVFSVGDATTFDLDETFSFIYSSATLLHLNDDDFVKALVNINKHLDLGGHLYITLKEGEGTEVDKAGRFFNYFTEEKLEKIIKESDLPFTLIDTVKSDDLGREDTTWLKFLISKKL